MENSFAKPGDLQIYINLPAETVIMVSVKAELQSDDRILEEDTSQRRGIGSFRRPQEGICLPVEKTILEEG